MIAQTQKMMSPSHFFLYFFQVTLSCTVNLSAWESRVSRCQYLSAVERSHNVLQLFDDAPRVRKKKTRSIGGDKEIPASRDANGTVIVPHYAGRGVQGGSGFDPHAQVNIFNTLRQSLSFANVNVNLMIALPKS